MIKSHLLKNLSYLGLIIASFLLAFSIPVSAGNASLTVASCPPWKHEGDKATSEKMLNMCQLDSQKITESLGNSFSIEKSNQHVLLQKDATPANLIEKLNTLRGTVGKGDTLFVYQMSHGGILPHKYKGYDTVGEVFAYYTVERPDVSNAVSKGQWLGARDLRDEISRFAVETGANVLIIIEACHAESAGHELMHNPIERLNDDEKIAYLFSAGAQQTSTFTDDNTQARFTSDLVLALNNAASGTSLADIFSAVRETTHRGALSKCNKLGKDTLKSVMGSVDYYFENCLQAPNYFDPKGLMLDLKKL